MNKRIVFDMDGTIADFYSVENWLECLENSDTKPYKKARPLYNTDELNNILYQLKAQGYIIVITSWLSKGSSKEFNNATRKAKREWLDKVNFPYDEIHLIKYGTTKANCTRKKGGYQILVDDNEQVRKGWQISNYI